MPGLIYDLVCVNPQSLAQRRADWVKVVKVWNRIVAFVTRSRQPGRGGEDHGGARRRAARGVREVPAGHALPDARRRRWRASSAKDTLDSLFGSGKVADEFNVANKVYAAPQPVAAYIDGSLSKEALAK